MYKIHYNILVPEITQSEKVALCIYNANWLDELYIELQSVHQFNECHSEWNTISTSTIWGRYGEIDELVC